MGLITDIGIEQQVMQELVIESPRNGRYKVTCSSSADRGITRNYRVEAGEGCSSAG